MPAFFFTHASLTRRHDPGDALRDLPVKLTVRHRSHAFFVRDVSWFATKSPARDARFIARASLAMTEDAVALRSFEIKLFTFRDRLGSRFGWVFSFVCVFGKLPRVLRKIRLLAAA